MAMKIAKPDGNLNIKIIFTGEHVVSGTSIGLIFRKVKSMHTEKTILRTTSSSSNNRCYMPGYWVV